MDNKTFDKVTAFFNRCKGCKVLYVAGGKIFTAEGAAQSYAAKVETVTRQEAASLAKSKTVKTE